MNSVASAHHGVERAEGLVEEQEVGLCRRALVNKITLNYTPTLEARP